MRICLAIACAVALISVMDSSEAQARGRGRSRSTGRGGSGGGMAPGSSGLVQSRNAQAAAQGAQMGAALNAQRNQMRAAENAKIHSPEYKAKKLEHAQRAAAHKAEDKAEHERFEASKYAHAPRLTAEQLDHETGEVSWPKMLRGSSYEEHRVALEKLFAKRAKSKTPVEGFAVQVKRHVEGMQASLKQDMSTAKANDYAASRRFLDSVTEEAQHPAREESPAA